MEVLVVIMIVGFVIGIFTNGGKFGNLLLNFSIAALMSAYLGLSQIINSLPKIPNVIIVFVLAYLCGTFCEKIWVKFIKK